MGCFLAKGSKGEKVVQLQNALKRQGYYTRQVDGDYGDFTVAAVKKYQSAKGLIVDGCVGDQTWGSLLSPVPDSVWKCVPSYQFEKQDTGWTCGPSSSVMALSELGVRSNEAEMSQHEKTVANSGTGHPTLMDGIRKQGQEFGVNLNVFEASFNKTGWEQLANWLADPNASVIVHGRTEGWKSHWKNGYGHYVFPIGINMQTSRIKIADPAKGVIEYSLSEFKKGMDMQSQPSLIVIKK